MAAKPRVTVRLAPSVLHALAYVAARDQLAPAEVARMMLGAQVEATLRKRGWVEDQQASWRAWLAEQAAAGARPETPTQEDYDALADGLPAAPLTPAPRQQQRPLSAVIAESGAVLQRLEARLQGGRSRL